MKRILIDYFADTHSQAQWQVAQTLAKTETCHRACLFPSAVFADTKKNKSSKDRIYGMPELKNKLKPLTDKNAQLVTCGIFYCRDSAEINVCGSLQTSLWFDSDVLRNRQQKHTAVRCAQA